MKFGLRDAGPLTLMALRFAATAFLLPLFPLPSKQQLATVVSLAMTFGVLHHGLMIVGLAGVDASIAAVVMQLGVPASIVLAYLVNGVTPTAREVTGTLIALVGITVVSMRPLQETGGLSLVLLAASAMVWAGANILRKQIPGAVTPTQLNVWIGAFSAGPMLIAAHYIEGLNVQFLAQAPARLWTVLLFLVVFSTLAAYGIWWHLVGRYRVALVSAFFVLGPIFGVWFSWLLLSEHVSTAQASGSLLAIIGIGLIIRNGNKAE